MPHMCFALGQERESTTAGRENESGGGLSRLVGRSEGIRSTIAQLLRSQQNRAFPSDANNPAIRAPPRAMNAYRHNDRNRNHLGRSVRVHRFFKWLAIVRNGLQSRKLRFSSGLSLDLGYIPTNYIQ